MNTNQTSICHDYENWDEFVLDFIQYSNFDLNSTLFDDIPSPTAHSPQSNYRELPLKPIETKGGPRYVTLRDLEMLGIQENTCLWVNETPLSPVSPVSSNSTETGSTTSETTTKKFKMVRMTKKGNIVRLNSPKQIPCPECGRVFTRKHDMYRHSKSIHKRDLSLVVD
jgi:uncharacterized C2H2 Zn-finger protein